MNPEVALYEACVQVAHPRLGESLAALPAPSLDLGARDAGVHELTTGGHTLLGVEPVYCHLPRGQDRRARRARVRGTAALGASWYGRRVLVVTAGVQIESPEVARSWPEQIQCPGTAQRLDSLSSADWDTVVDAFLGGADAGDDDEYPLDLPLMVKREADRVAEITSALDFPEGRNTPFMRSRAALRFDPAMAPTSPPSVVVRTLADTGSLTNGGFGLLVRVPGDMAPEAAAEAVLTALVDVSAQLWLLEDAETSLRQQGHQLDRAIDATGVGEHRKALRRLFRERAQYLNEIESVSHPARTVGSPSNGLDPDTLIEEAVHALDLGERRARVTNRFRGIGEVAAGITDLEPDPDIPPSPPSFDDNAASRLVRSTTNPFKALWLWFDQERRSRGATAGEATTGDTHARAIELHPFQNRSSLLGEVSSVLSLNAFMTATAGIFLSVVLQSGMAGDANASPIPPYDILFLFLATFAFFFSTLIYGRAASRIARLGTVGIDSMINTASSVSEYLGKYAFLIALPITVFRYLYGSSNANTISVGVAFLALGTLVAYQFLPYVSLLSEEIRGRRQIARGETEIEDLGGIGSDAWRRALIVILTGLTASAYFGALWPVPLVMHVACWCLVALLILLMLFSFVAPERKNPALYEVEDWDMLGAEEASLRDPHWRRDRV